MIRQTPGAVLWVEGTDAASFLHGLLSNDIEGLAVGTTAPALLLDATGHIQVMLRVHRTATDAFTLVTDTGQGERLAELLEQYHFSEDVEVLGPEQVTVVAVEDPASVSGADLVIEGTVPGTYDAIGEVVATTSGEDRPGIDPAELDAYRIAAGVPRFGVDIGARTLVHEAGLQRTAVSFTKGCYLGQETVARVEHRGGVRRRLVGLRLPDVSAPGAEVMKEGRRVGTLTSTGDHPILGPIGLATIRTEVAAGEHVQVVGQDGHSIVVELPFPAMRARA